MPPPPRASAPSRRTPRAGAGPVGRSRPPAARRAGARAYHRAAQRRLRRFRAGTLAVSIAALLLLIGGVPLDVDGQEPAPAPAAAQTGTAPLPDPGDAVGQATSTIRELAYNFYAFLPRLLLALGLLAFAVVLARVARLLIDRFLGAWERRAAIAALARLVIFLIAAVAAVSILAGDVRAVVGSVGLLGLAASWALQTPIESFTGWLLNSFRGYYKVGDRIAVGDVFGDVYRIDVLTTTVWEAGGPGKAVAAAQATGALITFPNWEVLRSNIVNYSRDFPYVWDEIAVAVANESDLAYSVSVIERTARTLLGTGMEDAAQRYEQLLRRARLAFEVEEVPRVYVSAGDSWTECTLRYLVPVRSRRRWASDLRIALAAELARPEHRGKILSVYPRTEVTLRERWPSPDAGQ